VEPSASSPDRPSSSRQLRRWGPIAIVAVVALVVGLVLALGGNGHSNHTQTGSTVNSTAISFQQAQAQHLKVTFPKGCDPSTGKARIPLYGVQPCFANAASNGGATAPGVTGTTIKVVVYMPEPNDPILAYVEGAIEDKDTNAQTIATYKSYDQLFESYYQTYGRSVDLIPFVGTGTANDDVAARADAAQVASMHPFAVWGGPALTTAWADQMAADHIFCISCVGDSSPQWYAQRAPYVFTLTPNGDQSDQILAEYVGKKLVGQPASHAGDPAFTHETRKFGLLYIDANSESAAYANEEANLLKTKYGVGLTEVAYTLDPASLQEQATTDIAKLKAAGVTSVIFSGDPVAPLTFTAQATAQHYFPEWIIGASALVDTSVFARTYDQRQWAHAFGISFLGARVARETSGAWFLYKWFTGTTPPAVDGYALILPQPEIFYGALQAAGPDLTAQTFQQGMFTLATPPGSITNPAFSYGSHGLWPYPSYNGLDDTTEIWWNPSAQGPDEVGKQGTGMYEYVDGGKRYVYGQWTTAPDQAFNPTGAITIYPQPPPTDAVPNYPSPAGAS
jgi:hypothetical protein